VPQAGDVAVASATIHKAPNVVKPVAPSTLASNSTAPILDPSTAVEASTAVVEPAPEGNGKALVLDSAEVAVNPAPPAKPLAKDALAARGGALELVTGDANGGTSVIAAEDGDAQQIELDKSDTFSKSVPTSPVLRHRHQHDLHVVPPTPSSPTMDRDHGHQSVDPILGPSPFGNGDDELKDDAYLTDKSGRTNDIPDMD
jgi:hypothetical protein